MENEKYFECPHCGVNLEYHEDCDAPKSYCKVCEGVITPSDKQVREIDNQDGNFEFK